MLLTVLYQFNFCAFLIYTEESQGAKTTSSLTDDNIRNWEDKLGICVFSRTLKYTTHEGQENHVSHAQAPVFPIRIKQTFREVQKKPPLLKK